MGADDIGAAATSAVTHPVIARSHNHRPALWSGVDQLEQDVVCLDTRSREADMNGRPNGPVRDPIDVGTVKDDFDLDTGSSMQLRESVHQPGALPGDRILVPGGLRDVVSVDEQHGTGCPNKVVDCLDAVVDDARREPQRHAR